MPLGRSLTLAARGAHLPRNLQSAECEPSPPCWFDRWDRGRFRILARNLTVSSLALAGVRRQLFLWVDDNYFSRSATTTTVSSVGQGRSPAAGRVCLKR